MGLGQMVGSPVIVINRHTGADVLVVSIFSLILVDGVLSFRVGHIQFYVTIITNKVQFAIKTLAYCFHGLWCIEVSYSLYKE